MGIKARLAIGGCGGSGLGMLLGAIAGFAIARARFPRPDWQPIELFTALIFLFGHVAAVGIWVIGGVIGGVLGSLIGAAAGAALSARSENPPGPKPPTDELVR